MAEIGFKLTNRKENKEETVLLDNLTSDTENNKYFVGMHDAIRAFVIDDLKGYLLGSNTARLEKRLQVLSELYKNEKKELVETYREILSWY